MAISEMIHLTNIYIYIHGLRDTHTDYWAIFDDRIIS